MDALSILLLVLFFSEKFSFLLYYLFIYLFYLCVGVSFFCFFLKFFCANRSTYLIARGFLVFRPVFLFFCLFFQDRNEHNMQAAQRCFRKRRLTCAGLCVRLLFHMGIRTPPIYSFLFTLCMCACVSRCV